MDNTGFLVAGYAVTWAALAWYAWRLERRWRAARRALERRSGETETGPAGPPGLEPSTGDEMAET